MRADRRSQRPRRAAAAACSTLGPQSSMSKSHSRCIHMVLRPSSLWDIYSATLASANQVSTRREHLTSASTVERDLQQRRLAQRFPNGLLTRKRTEVQLLPRPRYVL